MDQKSAESTERAVRTTRDDMASRPGPQRDALAAPVKTGASGLSLEPGTAEGPRIELHHYRPHAPIPHAGVHVHHFFELVAVTRGSGSHGVDGRKVGVEPGHVTWFAPGQSHDPRGLVACDRWVVGFSAEAIGGEGGDAEAFLSSPRSSLLLPFSPLVPAAERALVLPPPERARWARWLAELEAELRTPQLGHLEAARSLLRLMLVSLARQVMPGRVANPGDLSLLDGVFRFIEAKRHTPIGLRDVARAVHRSPAYLTDRVRRETGRTVLQWIIERRMADARSLLSSTELAVPEVAARAGYLDVKHFSEQFRRLHGSPPQRWRLAQRSL